MSRKLFKNLTKQQKFAIYFKDSGYEEVECRSGKYRCFEGPHFVFIGRSGAVRINNRNAVTGSRSHTKTYGKILVEWEKFLKDGNSWVEL